jgi:predicted component of type VI protein secretion system
LYEPRLLNATIAARPDENYKYGVNVQLKAAVRLGGQLRRVDFDLQMGANGVAMQPVEPSSTKGEM